MHSETVERCEGSLQDMCDPLLLHTLWNGGEICPEQNDTISNEIDSLILRGEYRKALEEALICLGLLAGRQEGWFFVQTSDVESVFQEYISIITDSSCLGDTEVQHVVEQIGIASLFMHMQCNVIGPYGQDVEASAALLKQVAPYTDSQSSDWILQELAENGEDMVGKIFFPEYLLLAKISFDGLEKASSSLRETIRRWWRFRIACCTQYILSERSKNLLDRIELLVHALEEGYQVDVEGHAQDRALLGVLHVEAANIFAVFGIIKKMKYHITKASDILGIDASLTGALGKRTVHQHDAHAQLVLQASLDENMASFERSRGTFPGTFLDENIFHLRDGHVEIDSRNRESNGLNVDSDVFKGGPKLVNAGDESVDLLRKDLTCPHQVIILSLCSYVKKSSSPDGTQPWELTAYAESILSQDRTEFLIRLAAHMEMARLEVKRSRTRERALITFERIKEILSNQDTDISKPARMAYAFTIKSPCRAILYKEVGEAFVACGLIGAAIGLFEDAELWDSLIVCYQLLQKNEIAEDLVRKRLEITPNDARLLCTLGDLVDSDEYYHKAWECSNGRSARAQRSLARSAMRREEFHVASCNWEKALALSPLHLEGWFSLGWCLMKTKKYEKAVHAFTRLVQMDPDDGRAWNNLATVHMKLKNWQEAFVAFGEASKHARDIWQTWENYCMVACQLKDFNTGGRALEHVVTLTRGESYNHGLLDMLVQSLRGLELTNAPKESIIRTKEQQLHNYVLNILKKIASSSKGSGDPKFWRIYAEYYSIVNEPSSKVECLSKQVRALQSSDWQSQEEDFLEYAEACMDLAKAHLSSPASTKTELSQSRMLLRNTLQRAKENFEDHEIYRAMQTLLDDIAQMLILKSH